MTRDDRRRAIGASTMVKSPAFAPWRMRNTGTPHAERRFHGGPGGRLVDEQRVARRSGR